MDQAQKNLEYMLKARAGTIRQYFGRASMYAHSIGPYQKLWTATIGFYYDAKGKIKNLLLIGERILETTLEENTSSEVRPILEETVRLFNRRSARSYERYQRSKKCSHSRRK